MSEELFARSLSRSEKLEAATRTTRTSEGQVKVKEQLTCKELAIK
jgi:hypothetical protein